MLRGAVILAGLLFLPSTGGAQERGDVLLGQVAVAGGDRVHLRGHDLWLYGITALDGRDASGGAAAAKLADVIAGRPLTCAVVSGEESELETRPEAVCKVGGIEGSDIAAIMVDAGWASAERSRSLRRIRPDLIKLYVRLEVEARAACLGLWRTRPACGRQSSK